MFNISKSLYQNYGNSETLHLVGNVLKISRVFKITNKSYHLNVYFVANVIYFSQVLYDRYYYPHLKKPKRDKEITWPWVTQLCVKLE